MPRTATIGPEIFARVNELVAEGKSRTEAFGQVGQERKSQPGTVAANYYRVARSQGQTGSRRRKKTSARRSAPRRGSATAASSGRRRRASAVSTASGDAELRQIAEQIADLTAQLVRRIEERDKRIRALLG
jgi:hypothetical protein